MCKPKRFGRLESIAHQVVASFVDELDASMVAIEVNEPVLFEDRIEVKVTVTFGGIEQAPEFVITFKKAADGQLTGQGTMSFCAKSLPGQKFTFKA